MKDQFQMYSMYEGGSGCTLRTIVLCQHLTKEQASNAFESF